MDKIAVLIDFFEKIWYDSVEVSRMNCYFWKGTQSTDRESDRYMQINNFGFYEDIRQAVDVERLQGRADYQLLCITKGEGVFTFDGKETVLKEAQAVLYRPGEVQCYRLAPKTDNFWIHFSGTEIGELLKRFKLTDTVYRIENMATVQGIFDKMLDCVAEENGTAEDVLCGLLISMLSKLCARQNATDAGILRVIREMKSENFKGKTCKEYALLAGLSEYHFIRKFKQVTHFTPHQYKAKLLAEKATDILRDTHMRVADVAEVLGFEDSLYFSRFYKKQTGKAPKKI
ncbi:MAG: helix-turn-helix transcriptional regulator [Clostridia bacterium]|nr:helix-turn-helix transcriptional regulator [Clostridia bacterium]